MNSAWPSALPPAPPPEQTALSLSGQSLVRTSVLAMTVRRRVSRHISRNWRRLSRQTLVARNISSVQMREFRVVVIVAGGNSVTISSFHSRRDFRFLRQAFPGCQSRTGDATPTLGLASWPKSPGGQTQGEEASAVSVGSRGQALGS